MKSLRNIGKGLIRLLGPLLFLSLLIKTVNPWLVSDLLKGIRIEIVLVSMILFPILILVKTSRWGIISRHLNMGISLKRLFQIYYISWFLGSIPLSGIGVLSKMVYIKEEGGSAGRTMISITIDKLFDIVGHMCFGLFAFFYFPKEIFKDNLLGAFYIGMALIMCLIFVFRAKIWEVCAKFVQRYIKKDNRQGEDNLETDIMAFLPSFDLRSVVIIMSLSVVIGLLRSLVLYGLAISLAIPVTFGLIVGCRALIGIINILPITINGLGTREAILLLLLPLSGISRESVLALGFAAFLWTVCYKLSGIVFWIRQPLPLNGILSIKEKMFKKESDIEVG
jgi:uncharacterized protein (TIRG00374 family)